MIIFYALGVYLSYLAYKQHDLILSHDGCFPANSAGYTKISRADLIMHITRARVLFLPQY